MPNRNANTTIGISTLMEPVASMPQIASEPHPCCHTRTMSPHAAPTDSRFSTTALSGMTTERKARASRRKVRPAITATTSGKAP
jgi:hypothetical protein